MLLILDISEFVFVKFDIHFGFVFLVFQCSVDNFLLFSNDILYREFINIVLFQNSSMPYSVCFLF